MSLKYVTVPPPPRSPLLYADVIARVAHFAVDRPAVACAAMGRVCRLWRAAVLADAALWERLCREHFPRLRIPRYLLLATVTTATTTTAGGALTSAPLLPDTSTSSGANDTSAAPFRSLFAFLAARMAQARRLRPIAGPELHPIEGCGGGYRGTSKGGKTLAGDTTTATTDSVDVNHRIAKEMDDDDAGEVAFSFACPFFGENLTPTGPGRYHCHACRRTVAAVGTHRELRAAVAAGHCVELSPSLTNAVVNPRLSLSSSSASSLSLLHPYDLRATSDVTPVSMVHNLVLLDNDGRSALALLRETYRCFSIRGVPWPEEREGGTSKDDNLKDERAPRFSYTEGPATGPLLIVARGDGARSVVITFSIFSAPHHPSTNTSTEGTATPATASASSAPTSAVMFRPPAFMLVADPTAMAAIVGTGEAEGAGTENRASAGDGNDREDPKVDGATVAKKVRPVLRPAFGEVMRKAKGTFVCAHDGAAVPPTGRTPPATTSKPTTATKTAAAPLRGLATRAGQSPSTAQPAPTSQQAHPSVAAGSQPAPSSRGPLVPLHRILDKMAMNIAPLPGHTPNQLYALAMSHLQPVRMRGSLRVTVNAPDVPATTTTKSTTSTNVVKR